jgi:hypothetical protein
MKEILDEHLLNFIFGAAFIIVCLGGVIALIIEVSK